MRTVKWTPTPLEIAFGRGSFTLADPFLTTEENPVKKKKPTQVVHFNSLQDGDRVLNVVEVNGKAVSGHWGVWVHKREGSTGWKYEREAEIPNVSDEDRWHNQYLLIERDEPEINEFGTVVP
jgi:hypothetical protein